MPDAITVETPDLARVSARLRRISTTMPSIARRALNRGAKSGRQVVIKAVARRAGVKAADLRANLKVRNATDRKLEAEITAVGRVARRGRQTRTGVTFRGTAEPRKLRGGFVWQRHVFVRFGRPRLPIRLITFRTAQLWTPETAAARVAGAATIDKTITHELSRL